MLEALENMTDEEMESLAKLGEKLQPNLTPLLSPSTNEPNLSSSKNRQRKRTGSGGAGSDEIGSELLAPLSGKYLRQEKELKSLAGAICFGLVAAAKTSGNQALFLDAQTVAKYGGEVAHACAVLGRRYTWLHEILDKLCAGSMIAIVLSPVSAMISEIASNHGYTIPSLRLGTDNSTTERAAVL
jgi:hypothetical protein